MDGERAPRLSPTCGLLQLVFVFALLQAALAATQRLDDFDPRITYNKPVLPETTCKGQAGNEACSGNWWYELGDSNGQDFNNSIHDTFGPGTTATLHFQGSSISVFGVKLDFGARATVTVDGAASDSINCVSDDGKLQPQQLLFQQTDLDPNLPHVIVIAYDQTSFGDVNHRRWLGIDYFEIETAAQTDPTIPPSTSSPPPVLTSASPSSAPTTSVARSTASSSLETSIPSSSAGLETDPASSVTNQSGDIISNSQTPIVPSSTAAPAAESHNNAAAIAGGVVGGVILLAIAGVLLFLVRRRLAADARVQTQTPAWMPSYLAHTDAIGAYTVDSHRATAGSAQAPNPFFPPVASSHTPSSLSRPSVAGPAPPPLPPASTPPAYSTGGRNVSVGGTKIRT